MFRITCAKEQYAEDDFASSGDFGLAALLRALIKALEAQGRGFAHGHEQIHSEPMTKAIDLILALRGPDAAATTVRPDFQRG